LIKSVGKSEHGCCDHKTSRRRWGELGLGRRRRNRGGVGRQSCHILTFSDGFTDGNSVGETVGDSDENIDTSPYGSAISNPSVSPSAI
jgi:hypothetical protein